MRRFANQRQAFESRWAPLKQRWRAVKDAVQACRAALSPQRLRAYWREFKRALREWLTDSGLMQVWNRWRAIQRSMDATLRRIGFYRLCGAVGRLLRAGLAKAEKIGFRYWARIVPGGVVRKKEVQSLYRFLPESEHTTVAQYVALRKRIGAPRVVAVGQYNHGKSSLLNALIGRRVFSVADRRETREVRRVESAGIVWVDTPGLDADVLEEDDRKALEAAVGEADIRLLVHSVRMGELDARECERFTHWIGEAEAMEGAAAAVVLTQVDQLEEAELERVIETVRRQVPRGVPVWPVASTLAWESSQALRAASGLDPLRAWIQEQKAALIARRSQLRQALRRRISGSLEARLQEARREHERLRAAVAQREEAFLKEVEALVR